MAKRKGVPPGEEPDPDVRYEIWVPQSWLERIEVVAKARGLNKPGYIRQTLIEQLERDEQRQTDDQV